MHVVECPLAIYLHDHLAGATYALDLVQALRDHYKGQALAELASQLHTEIVAGKDTLERIAESFGPASDFIKHIAAWLSEKVSRLKLDHSNPTGLGTFEALEFLALGIHCKRAMWRALSEISRDEPALTNVDFASLIARAENQERLVEEQRLIAAHRTLDSSLRE